MRKSLPILGLVALATAMSAQAETIYVAGTGGSTEKTFKEKIIPAFKAKTGVDVVYVTGNSTDVLAKLQAQKSRQEISFAMIDDGPMYQAVEQGLCARVEEAGSVKDLYPNARMLGGKSVGVGFIATGLAYNKDI
ncbi:MAG: extracellular solute-binding protein, partial [Ramlibacter sp.]